MGDDNKYQIDLSTLDLGNITIGPSDTYQDYLKAGYGYTDYITDMSYPDWLESTANITLSGITDYDDYVYPFPESGLKSDNVTLTGGGEEMLRVSADGFYIRGVRVEADEKEAEKVYKAFKQWMTWAIINGQIEN